MPTHAALLRGVNIGPRKRIAMADLRAVVASLGHTDVATYLNSGNAVFTPGTPVPDAALAGAIHTALLDQLELDVSVIVRSASALQAVIDDNPFPEVVATPKLLHVAFLEREPDPEHVAALASVTRGDDAYRIVRDVAYLHYPNGIGKATFMPKGLDRALGMATTARNWNTLCALAAMTRQER